jgi:hypothetical protein
MKYLHLAISLLALLFVQSELAVGQSDVTTSGGTANVIPLFTDPTNIQNSILTQTGTSAVAVGGQLNACTINGLISVSSGVGCYSSLDSIFIAMPSGGYVVYLPASSYPCPTMTIPNNTAIIGLGSFADGTFIGAQASPDYVKAQVTIGPCSGNLNLSSSQNVKLQNLTIDFDDKGGGLYMDNAIADQLIGVNIIRAGSSTVPALALAASSSGRSVQNKFDHIQIHCTRQSSSSYCLAGIYLGGVVAPAAPVTNNSFYDISMDGNMKCGIEIEAQSDTNQFVTGEINPNSYSGAPASSAAFCFNLNSSSTDVDANGDFFSGIAVTGCCNDLSFNQYWNAGQSSGHVFLFTDATPTAPYFHVFGGSPVPPTVLTETLGSSGQTSFYTDNLIASNLTVSGTKHFRIDDPLDPANKYLYHTSVESPDMMNLYNGTVILDEGGEATVKLPDWFEALNRDFRYQLTCIGGFAPVYIAQEIGNNTFRIAGGAPGLKVSWQVTGVRHDAYAEAHPSPVEVEKPLAERGHYLHPELYLK